MFSPKRGCRRPALAAGRNQLTKASRPPLRCPGFAPRGIVYYFFDPTFDLLSETPENLYYFLLLGSRVHCEACPSCQSDHESSWTQNMRASTGAATRRAQPLRACLSDQRVQRLMVLSLMRIQILQCRTTARLVQWPLLRNFSDQLNRG